MTKYDVLDLLKQNSNQYLSGEQISKTLNLSRTAIWKAIQTLRKEGYQIDAVTNKGYQLIEQKEIFSAYELKRRLKTSWLGNTMVFLKEVSSTNDYAKTIVNSVKTGHLILADMQTNGKGKQKQTFHSPEGLGVYMSLILKENIVLQQISELRLLVLDSIVHAVENQTGNLCELKHPNEIFYQGKKISGILIEVSLESETDEIEYAVVGMGVYTSASIFGVSINRLDLTADIINQLEAALLGSGCINHSVLEHNNSNRT